MEYSTSSFGINIGTGLMLESALTPTTDRLDEDRVIPPRVDLKTYDIWYINLHSFIVNVISSYDKDTVESILRGHTSMVNMVVEKVSDEMEVLVSIIPIKIIFFYLGYPKYKQYLNTITDDTKVGKIYNTALKIVKILKADSYKETGVLSMNTKSLLMIEENGNVIKNKNSKGLMTTSNPLDLIHSMPLLEFHTGVLKGRNQFYTKLKTKNPIPFEEVLLLLLGDKKGMIKSPLSSKEKKYLFEAIMKKRMKPYARYKKSAFILIVDDKDLVKKIKETPNIY